MKLHSDGPSIPDLLFQECEEGNVVFLCGAGVSINSGMPSFIELIEYVIAHFKPAKHSNVRAAFSSSQDDTSAGTVSLDRIFTMLHDEFGKDDVNDQVTRRLQIQSTEEHVGCEHALIKRISLSKRGIPQIVTTNFDLLFEHGEGAEDIPYHVPKKLPDPALGAEIEGITYLHGRLASIGSSDALYILSEADFGSAYISGAWATNFISELLQRYIVVIVGYRADDVPLNYFLQGLNQDAKSTQKQLFAFEKGNPNEVQARWKKRGVTSIAYKEHEHLWLTMKAWADFADDPQVWRIKVLKLTECDPKLKSPLERGQVVHVLRSAQGARLLAEADPPAHAEWICVLDASIRSTNRSSGSDNDNPSKVYGLDDDIESTGNQGDMRSVRNDHLLQWRIGDDNPPEFHRLGDRQAEGRETMPLRLDYLSWWIANSYNSPVIAWWAARQNGLHPKLIDRIDLHLRGDKEIDETCLRIWNLILEYHRDSRNRSLDTSWFEFKMRLKKEGWIPSVLREFHHECQPRLVIHRPMGPSNYSPPTSDWKSLKLKEVGQFQVRYMKNGGEGLKDSDVSDEALPIVLSIMESHFGIVAGLLSDISDLEPRYFNTPHSHSTRESDKEEYFFKFANPFRLFIELLDRLVVINSELARAHVIRWDEGDKYFFRKLKLYALSNSDLFEANEMAGIISQFDDEAIWDINVAPELLFTLVAHWHCLSREWKEDLSERILCGPQENGYRTGKKHSDYRDRRAATYGRYLQMKKCDFAASHLTKLNDLIAGIPDWNDERVNSIVAGVRIGGGFVKTDETPEGLLGLKLSEIVPRAEIELQRDFDSLTEKRPFTGLVKENPRRALAALSLETRKGRFPEFAWQALIDEFPNEASTRLYIVFLIGLTRMPHTLIVELRHSLGAWLERSLGEILELNANLGWKVFDHLLNGILSGGQEAVASGIVDYFQGGQAIKRSRRTIDHAFNGPLGKFANALLNATSRKKPKADSLIPDQVKTRVTRLLATSGEGADHTVLILMSRLSMIMNVDPAWTKEYLIPMLEFDHPASEPAWNGLFHSQDSPSIEVAQAILHFLPDLYPWITKFDWYDDVSEIMVQWLASMYVSRSNELEGFNSDEMRDLIRAMRERSRLHMICWLEQFGSSKKNHWCLLVIPFINEVWPKELRFRSKDSTRQWIRLLEKTKDDFHAVYSAVKCLLSPVDIGRVDFHGITREREKDVPVAKQHPEDVLDLMDKLVPKKLPPVFDALPLILEFVVEAAPKLQADSRYTRLIKLMDQS